MDVTEILQEVAKMRDVSQLSDDDILGFVGALNRRLSQGNQVFGTVTMSLLPGVCCYDVDVLPEDIAAVYVDGRKLLRVKSLATMEGWRWLEGAVEVSPALTAAGGVLTVEYRLLPPALPDSGDLALPPAYHMLYVYHALAEIAAREGDNAGYSNYREDFNALYEAYMQYLRQHQAYPRL